MLHFWYLWTKTVSKTVVICCCCFRFVVVVVLGGRKTLPIATHGLHCHSQNDSRTVIGSGLVTMSQFNVLNKLFNILLCNSFTSLFERKLHAQDRTVVLANEGFHDIIVSSIDLPTLHWLTDVKKSEGENKRSNIEHARLTSHRQVALTIDLNDSHRSCTTASNLLVINCFVPPTPTPAPRWVA